MNPSGETSVKPDPASQFETILDALASSNRAAIRNREEIAKLRAVMLAGLIVAALLYVRSKS